MRAVISVDRPFHSVLLANSVAAHGHSVKIYSSAPRRFFKGLHDLVQTHLVPSPLQIAGHFLHRSFPRRLTSLDTGFFDASVSAVMGRPELYFGWATESLYSARHTKKYGGVFILDRACPHRDFQENMVERESDRLGVPYVRQPQWFRNRQLEEYELARAILVPSEYTARTFPEPLRGKLIRAPLLGRCSEPKSIRNTPQATFTVGVVGGSPIRKGYLYLLRAWKKLALPNSKLILRSGDLSAYPALRELLSGMTNVEFVGYVPDISDFYQRCDVFILPSIDDGFGMALIEAMMNGRACITTTNTGASELLTDGQDALIIDPADEDQLATAVLRLHQDPSFRAHLAASAVVRAKEIAADGLYDKAIASLLRSLSGRIG